METRIICEDSATQKVVDNLQLATWVHGLAPWSVMSHFTWRPKEFKLRDGGTKSCGVSLDSARFYFERFMRNDYSRLSYFYAIEQNPGEPGHHIHALFADDPNLYRKEMWAAWFKRFGRNKVEPVKCLGDVVDYCSKYVTKEGAWWNVCLQWHHRQKLAGATFNLGGS